MRLAVTITAVIMSLITTTATAWAETSPSCSDAGVADCGSFKFIKNTCKTFDARGRANGVTESMWIVFDDPGLGRILASLEVTSDLASYTTMLNEDTTLIVNHQSRILADINNKTAYTFVYVEKGSKGTERSCQLLDPKER